MSVLNHEEQASLDGIKSWWRQYGSKVSAVVLAAAIGILLWQGYHYWHARRAQLVNEQYQAIQKAIVSADTQVVRDLAGELLEKYPGAPVSALGILAASRFMHQAEEYAEEVEEYLSWLASESSYGALSDMARLDLAAIKIDQDDLESAKKWLDYEPVDAFSSKFLARQADVALLEGKPGQALSFLKKAIEKEREQTDFVLGKGSQSYLPALEERVAILEGIGASDQLEASEK